MREDLANTLSRLLWPLVTIVVVLAIRWMRGLSWRDDLGFRWPSWPQAALWLGLFVLLFLAEEIAARTWGIAQAQPWGTRYTPAEAAVRVFAMVVLSPFAEELLFRGLLFGILSQTALGPSGAIFVTAFLFALLHGQYFNAAMVLVLADALFFGAARCFTGSMLLPLLCHSLGNAYAAYERVAR